MPPIFGLLPTDSPQEKLKPETINPGIGTVWLWLAVGVLILFAFT